jgi:anti-sigma regulatory factor (Ser/Thr protein kinase)
LENGQIGGFGLFFIYRSMDTVTYESTAGCNTLTMIKRLDSPEQGSEGDNTHRR